MGMQVELGSRWPYHPRRWPFIQFGPNPVGDRHVDVFDYIDGGWAFLEDVMGQ